MIRNIHERRKYAREWKANRRTSFFKDKCCANCGSTERLELDHIDPTTKISHNIWSWAEVRRTAEITKCQVLCYHCHKEKTKVELSKPIIHGANVTYCIHACRCNKCTTAHTKYRREYRERTEKR